uniref:amino acid ABC transporter ATP-binding protein n=1 Tax=Paraburkholderia tropica TaxID=92647 RepID=UPI0038BAD455
MSHLIAVRNLHKSFGKLEVLKGIDLSIDKGETVVILGASGSGKSTLLRCLNLLELPTSGYLEFDGRTVGCADAGGSVTYRERDLCELRKQVGMVFQQFNLFPHLSVLDNVAIPQVKVLGRSKVEARKRAGVYLEKVGMSQKADAFPARLSGGQQQRVAIARALAMEPSAMLFDEATSALDPELVGEVLSTMKQLSNEGMTMVIVTHELGFAYNVAHRVVFLHEGCVYEDGYPDEVLVHPKKPKTQDFLRGHQTFSLPKAEFCSVSPLTKVVG